MKKGMTIEENGFKRSKMRQREKRKKRERNERRGKIEEGGRKK